MSLKKLHEIINRHQQVITELELRIKSVEERINEKEKLLSKLIKKKKRVERAVKAMEKPDNVREKIEPEDLSNPESSDFDNEDDKDY